MESVGESEGEVLDQRIEELARALEELGRQRQQNDDGTEQENEDNRPQDDEGEEQGNEEVNSSDTDSLFHGLRTPDDF